MNLGAFFDRASINPLALVEATIEQALNQLAREGALSGDGDRPPEELIATALGNRLAGLIASDRSPSGDGRGSSDPQQHQRSVYEHLINRNSVLAAAVGACDCWGEQVECPFCAGAGTPGWIVPDRELFANYVYPAIRAAARGRATQIGATRRIHNQRKDNGYVEYLVR